MPISRDMAIFVLTTTTAQPITLPHAQGVIITPWVLPRVKNETQGVFSMSYIILSHLLILLSLRCLDLLIFMLITTTTITTRPITLPRVHARGVKIMKD